VIPDIQIPIYHLGPIPVDPWGTLVCIGFVVGLEIARARAIRLGYDIRDIVDGTVSIVLSGFVVGHLVHVLAYHPEQFEKDGMLSLLRIWAGFSSFGGFIGALIGANVFFRWVRKRPFWEHADIIMFGFPFGWIFGRLGCFIAQDHIGKPSTFFLAQQFSRYGTRHNLGLYEALGTMAIAGIFLWMDRQPRRAGYFAMLWCLLYAPLRFGLDFLRNTDLENHDVRWAGLTPAQWGCLLMFGGGLLLARRVSMPPPVPPEEKKAPDPSEESLPNGSAQSEDRRHWFRMLTPSGSTAILRVGDGARVAPLVDISGGGVSVMLAVRLDDHADIEAGTLIPQMELRVIGLPVLRCQAVVRSVRASLDPDTPGLVCGVEISPNSNVRSTLVHYVLQRERNLLQHRSAIRACPAEEDPLHAVLIGPDHQTTILPISNISATGMVLHTPAMGWEIGQVIHDFRIELPGEFALMLDARVMQLEGGNEQGTELLVGLSFVEINSSDQQRLERWIRRWLGNTG